MAYVNSDGTITQKPPIYEQCIRFVFGVFTFIIFFFKSLFGVDSTNSSSNQNSGGIFRGSSSGGSNGWGSGGGGSNTFGNRRPNVKTMRDINPPIVRGVGGCPGGGCGM